MSPELISKSSSAFELHVYDLGVVRGNQKNTAFKRPLHGAHRVVLHHERLIIMHRVNMMHCSGLH